MLIETIDTNNFSNDLLQCRRSFYNPLILFFTFSDFPTCYFRFDMPALRTNPSVTIHVWRCRSSGVHLRTTLFTTLCHSSSSFNTLAVLSPYFLYSIKNVMPSKRLLLLQSQTPQSLCFLAPLVAWKFHKLPWLLQPKRPPIP